MPIERLLQMYGAPKEEVAAAEAVAIARDLKAEPGEGAVDGTSNGGDEDDNDDEDDDEDARGSGEDEDEDESGSGSGEEESSGDDDDESDDSEEEDGEEDDSRRQSLSLTVGGMARPSYSALPPGRA
jgi:hypothetical protein